MDLVLDLFKKMATVDTVNLLLKMNQFFQTEWYLKMKTLESKVRKAKKEYETLKAQYETLKSLNWDIFYGREEGVHDLKKENELGKQVEAAQKKMEQLEGFLKTKKES